MKIALYVGDHAGDTLAVRLGWALTRLAQKGPFDNVTHCEAILDELPDGTCQIASSSLRDGGVRVKTCFLNPRSWLIVNVPLWSVDRARTFFEAAEGEKYDWRGALATVLPGSHQSGRLFCNEAVGAAVGLLTPHCFHPAQFAAICLTLGQDVTAEFFTSRPSGT